MKKIIRIKDILGIIETTFDKYICIDFNGNTIVDTNNGIQFMNLVGNLEAKPCIRIDDNEITFFTKENENA